MIDKYSYGSQKTKKFDHTKTHNPGEYEVILMNIKTTNKILYKVFIFGRIFLEKSVWHLFVLKIHCILAWIKYYYFL